MMKSELYKNKHLTSQLPSNGPLPFNDGRQLMAAATKANLKATQASSPLADLLFCAGALITFSDQCA